VGAEGTLPLAAPALAAFFFVSGDLKLWKDE
jgi:hypothetical protein